MARTALGGFATVRFSLDICGKLPIALMKAAFNPAVLGLVHRRAVQIAYSSAIDSRYSIAIVLEWIRAKRWWLRP